jgi:hypothetical protein
MKLINFAIFRSCALPVASTVGPACLRIARQCRRVQPTSHLPNTTADESLLPDRLYVDIIYRTQANRSKGTSLTGDRILAWDSCFVKGVMIQGLNVEPNKRKLILGMICQIFIGLLRRDAGSRSRSGQSLNINSCHRPLPRMKVMLASQKGKS